MTEVRTLLRQLRRQGLDVGMGGSGHWIVRKDGRMVASLPATPGGGNRSLLNARANLRRAGISA